MKIKIEVDTKNCADGDRIVRIIRETIDKTKEIMNKVKEEQSDVAED